MFSGAIMEHSVSRGGNVSCTFVQSKIHYGVKSRWWTPSATCPTNSDLRIEFWVSAPMLSTKWTSPLQQWLSRFRNILQMGICKKIHCQMLKQAVCSCQHLDPGQRTLGCSWLEFCLGLQDVVARRSFSSQGLGLPNLLVGWCGTCDASTLNPMGSGRDLWWVHDGVYKMQSHIGVGTKPTDPEGEPRARETVVLLLFLPDLIDFIMKPLAKSSHTCSHQTKKNWVFLAAWRTDVFILGNSSIKLSCETLVLCGPHFNWKIFTCRSNCQPQDSNCILENSFNATNGKMLKSWISSSHGAAVQKVLGWPHCVLYISRVHIKNKPFARTPLYSFFSPQAQSLKLFVGKAETDKEEVVNLRRVCMQCTHPLQDSGAHNQSLQRKMDGDFIGLIIRLGWSELSETLSEFCTDNWWLFCSVNFLVHSPPLVPQSV